MTSRGAGVSPGPGRVRAVTFDLTGTLIHPPRAGEIYSEVLGRHGIRLAPAEARRLIRLVWTELDCRSRPGEDRFAAHPGGARGWWRRFLDRICEHAGTERPSRFAAAELFDRFARAGAWEVFPDAVPALDALRRAGIRLALLSNWDERLPELMRDLGLTERFEALVYSAAVGVEKPHPAIFRRALETLGLPPAAVAHVGDRRRDDLEGAEAVGMRGFLLDRAGAGDLADLRELTALCGAPGPGNG